MTPASHPRLRWMLGWMAALLLGALSLLLNWRHVALDQGLPWDDAPRYLRLLARWDRVFDGWPLPGDAHSPLLFLAGVGAQDLLGPGVDGALLATGLFAAVLVVGCSRLGMAAAGPWGAVLVPLVVLASPYLGTYSRTFLLDVPGVAWIPWVLLYAATSDGFRRPCQTLLMGVALALLVLSKYQFLFWVLPIVVAPFLVMLVRSPASLLGLLPAVPSAGWILHRLVQRSAESPMGSPPPLAPALWELWPVAGAGLVLLLAARAALHLRAGPRQGARLRPGLHLGAAALLCLALATPWLYLAAPSIATHSAEVTGREWQDLDQQLRAVRQVKLRSWPQAAGLLAAAAGLWGLDLALTRTRLGALPVLRRLRADTPARLLMPAALLLAAALGTWISVRELPINPRYYLPLVVLVGVFIGVSTARPPVLRWLLGLPLAGVCLLQLLHWELGPRFDALTAYGAEADAFERDRGPDLPAPRYAVSQRSEPAGPGGAVERMFAVAASFMPPPPRNSPGCRRLAVVNALPVEPVALTSLADLHGFTECQVFDAGRAEVIAEGTVDLRTTGQQGPVLPEVVLVVGAPEALREGVVAGLRSGSGLELQRVEEQRLPGGEVVALYRASP